MASVADALTEATRALAAADVENPRAEARLLLEAATGLSRERLVARPEVPLDSEAAERLRALTARRAAREPMAYIRGWAEFWSLRFRVGPGVLVPRPETETLIEAALAAFPDRARPLRVLDIGTGSGCLALTLLHLYPAARAIGTDTEPAALVCAKRNAAALGVADRARLVRTRWAEALAGPFDLVVGNPPYVATAAIDRLAPEVARHEPRAALDGGADGLDAYHAILADLPRLLTPDGVALLEIGRGQDAALIALAAAAGFAVRRRRDLAGIVRCLELRRASPAGAPR